MTPARHRGERVVEERLLRAMNEDFERLRGDEAEWRAFKAETAVWDAASASVELP